MLIGGYCIGPGLIIHFKESGVFIPQSVFALGVPTVLIKGP